MSADAIVSLLIEVSWRAVVLAVLVGGVLMLWRVQGGAVRHAAWTVAMVAMLLMPALMAVVPDVPVRLPGVATLETTPAQAPVLREVAQGSEPGSDSGRLVAPSSKPAPVETAQPVARFAWQQISIAVWLAGLAVNLVVMAMGWRLARRLIATARVSDIDPRVMESPSVAAPCAVGLWRVQVLVPQAWRTWSRAGRDAVLQHELAHVSRRDLFVLFVARVNRSIFWFHPVSWWLERRIAATAEQACDEAVLSAGQDPQRYASVLVDMATALRTRGARVAWQSLGMAEGTDLESRIERVLTGAVPRLTRGRVVGVMAMSIMALIVAVACTQAPPELAVNPEITARMERDVDSRALSAAVRSMSDDDVKALTDQVLANPDDRALVERLTQFYSAQWDIRPGTEFMPGQAFLESHRRVVLWAIEHRPEGSLVEWRVPRRADPTGYQAARAQWDTHLASQHVSMGSYDQAISFTLMSDPAAAERMVQAARRRFPRIVKPNGEPGASADAYWTRRLAEVYAAVIQGTYENPRAMLALEPSVSNSPEARRALALIDSSSDPVLVGDVGDRLWTADRELGRKYIRRSLQLDPAQPARMNALERKEWQAVLGSQQEKVRALTGVNSLEDLTPDQVLALPEDLQWTTLPHLAERAYAKAMSRGFQNTSDSEWNEQLRRATLYSDRAIALLERRSDPGLVRVRYQAHVVRGWAAIAVDDSALAITHLKAATDALEEKPMILMDGRGPFHTLTNYLIKAGETTVVAEIFDRVSEPHYSELREAAADLRAGRMPDQYQRMMASLKTQK